MQRCTEVGLYTALLIVHSILRWVVVVSGLLAVITSVLALQRKSGWTPRHNLTSLTFVASLDLQLVLGLGLYFGLSPLVSTALGNMKVAMKNSELRFWAVEHITVMVLAIAVGHITRVRARKADNDTARLRRTAVGFAITLLLIFAAIPWPFLSHARPWLRLS